MVREIHLPDAGATIALGETLGAAAREGDVVALEGPLGAGKTCLAQGFAAGVGVADLRLVNSPTFSIWNIHPGRLVLHHMDLYRLGDPDEALALGLEEAIGVEGVCLIEWASRMPWLLPPDHLEIRLEPASTGRSALVVARGARSARLLSAIPP